jgi:hypothetical protein
VDAHNRRFEQRLWEQSWFTCCILRALGAKDVTPEDINPMTLAKDQPAKRLTRRQQLKALQSAFPNANIPDK